VLAKSFLSISHSDSVAWERETTSADNSSISAQEKTVKHTRGTISTCKLYRRNLWSSKIMTSVNVQNLVSKLCNNITILIHFPLMQAPANTFNHYLGILLRKYRLLQRKLFHHWLLNSDPVPTEDNICHIDNKLEHPMQLHNWQHKLEQKSSLKHSHTTCYTAWITLGPETLEVLGHSLLPLPCKTIYLQGVSGASSCQCFFSMSLSHHINQPWDHGDTRLLAPTSLMSV
jgi:hypothetical protein